MAIPLRSWAVSVDGAGPRRSVYREFRPAPEVAAAVVCSWQGHAGWERSMRLLPDGCADLMWNGRAFAVVVTAAVPWNLRLADPAGWTVGVRLRCGAAGSLLGQALWELPVGATPLNDLWDGRWGEAARRTRETLASCPSPAVGRSIMESLVAKRLRGGFEPDPVTVTAARALRVSDARIPDLAAGLGVSERGLRRHLRDEVGVGPKQLHRVLRWRRFLHRIEAIAGGRTLLAVVAAELGYADQSHLGRECRRLSGSSPAALIHSWARQGAVAETFQTSPAMYRRIEAGRPTEHGSSS